MMLPHCLPLSPQIQALTVINDPLEQDDTLWDRTVLSVQNIIEILGFCLHNTYFSFQDKFYEEFEGAPMGSLVSPTVANLYMEHLEREALWSAPKNSQTLVQVCGWHFCHPTTGQ